MGKHYRNIKAVKQEDNTSCWAACLEWWLKAVVNRPKKEQWEIIADYSQYWETTPDGTISRLGLCKLVYDARWRMKVQYQLPWNMREETLLEHLSRGPVYIGYYDKKVNGKHVNVIYDSYRNGGVLKLRAMEPNKGKHSIRNFSYYTRGEELVLASPQP